MTTKLEPINQEPCKCCGTMAYVPSDKLCFVCAVGFYEFALKEGRLPVMSDLQPDLNLRDRYIKSLKK